MGVAVLGRQALHRAQLIIDSGLDRPQAEQRRAALAYLIWPAALYERYVEREPASSWFRLQIRQAMAFGVRWMGIAAIALLWPLVISLVFGSLTATLTVYTIAIVLDCMVFVVWLRLALRYSKRASRGETFGLDSLLPGRTQSHRG